MDWDMAMLSLMIAAVLAYPIYWLVRWCRTIMGTWVDPMPAPDRSTNRRPEIDPEWEADYGHVRHED